jgi:hypothetical protein
MYYICVLVDICPLGCIIFKVYVSIAAFLNEEKIITITKTILENVSINILSFLQELFFVSSNMINYLRDDFFS